MNDNQKFIRIVELIGKMVKKRVEGKNDKDFYSTDE